MAHTATDLPEVLTLAETAEYLRVPESEVLELTQSQGLPGRMIGSQWRFLKMAIEDWLRVSDRKAFWAEHVGALRDDPYLQGMVEQIYKHREQPAVETE
jgi:excisionase family DNA binding protein